MRLRDLHRTGELGHEKRAGLKPPDVKHSRSANQRLWAGRSVWVGQSGDLAVLSTGTKVSSIYFTCAAMVWSTLFSSALG